MTVTEAVLAVASALETVNVSGVQNCRTIVNCIDALHSVAEAIGNANAAQNAESGPEEEKEGAEK